MKSKYLYLCTSLSILLLLSACNSSQHKAYRLVKAFDGDSMLLVDYDCKIDCPNTQVRLLGIDAPESSQEPWGPKSREFLLSQLHDDTKIYIETDYNPIDKYGRTLVYLFYTDAEKPNSQNLQLLNEKLLANGYAEIFILGSNLKYADKLKAAEYQAKSQHLHIWDLNNGLTMSPYKYRKSHKKR